MRETFSNLRNGSATSAPTALFEIVSASSGMVQTAMNLGMIKATTETRTTIAAIVARSWIFLLFAR